LNVQPGRYWEADLHCHTSASDGLLTPRQLVQLAAERKIRAVGITDHDTIQGWAEAELAGSEYGVDVLRGIELNTDWNGIEVHILGYQINAESTYLHERLKYLRMARQQRMLEILERLYELGIVLTANDIQEFAQGESTGRPHIAQALVKHGYVSNNREAFTRYLAQGAPAYVPRFKLTPEEGIQLVRQAEGVAVLAHPGVHRLEVGVPAWVGVGLQGIEVRHSEHGPAEEERCRTVAEQYGLLMTGGSDFHGEARKPGVELGGWGVKLDVVREIRLLARAGIRETGGILC